jgi:CRP-like cAMP-binding protein
MLVAAHRNVTRFCANKAHMRNSTGVGLWRAGSWETRLRFRLIEGEKRMTRPANGFLQSLTSGDFDLLRPDLGEVDLSCCKMLYDVGGKISRLYFPHSGIISIVVVLSTGEQIEAGMVGSDSVVGTSAALDGDTAFNRCIVRVPGAASVIDADVAKRAVASSRSLREKFYQHDRMLMAQAQQTAACNATHELEARLCRWLLRAHDLLKSDTLDLTQEYIAQMLGVRRTSVTMAAVHLQKLNLVSYRRGHIRVLDLDGLKEAACECNEAIKAQAALLVSTSELESARELAPA